MAHKRIEPQKITEENNPLPLELRERATPAIIRAMVDFLERQEYAERHRRRDRLFTGTSGLSRKPGGEVSCTPKTSSRDSAAKKQPPPRTLNTRQVQP